MRRDVHTLDWQCVDVGIWLARPVRLVGGKYRIRLRELKTEIGRVYDVHRLAPLGESYLGSALTIERAMAIAQASYQKLRTATNFEQPVKGKKIVQGLRR